jgi:hypothetical protein
MLDVKQKNKYNRDALRELRRRYVGDRIKEYYMTCFYCKGWERCPFAYDLYNTNGDCLGLK